MVSGTKPAVQVVVGAKTDAAEKKIATFGDNLTKSFAKANLAAKAVELAISAVGAGLGKLVDLTKESIRLAGIQEKAESRFVATLRARGIETKNALGSIQKFNAHLQQQVGIGDEVLLGYEAQLLALGATKDELETLVLAAIGLTESGADMNAAIMAVGKSLTQGRKAFTEYGILTGELSDVIEKLANDANITAEKHDTLSGRTKDVAGSYNDLLEEIGKLVTKAPSLNRLLDTQNQILKDMGAWVKDNDDTVLGFFDRFGMYLERMQDQIRSMGASDIWSAVLSPMQTFMTMNAEAQLGALTAESSADGMQKREGQKAPRTIKYKKTKITKRITPAEKAAIIGRQKEAARLRQEIEDREALELYERNKRKRHRREQSFAEEEEAEAARLERYAEGREYWRQLNQESEDRRVQEKIDSDFAVEQMEADHWGRMIDVAATGAVMLAETLGAGLVTGEMNAKKALGSFAAMVLSTLGDLFISLGTAAIVGGKASTALPFLAGIFGGPVGVGTGIALIGAGAVLKGAAAGISAYANKPTEQANQAKSAAASSRRNERRTAQGRPMPVTGGGPMVVHVNFNQPIGSPRKAARAIHDTLRAGGTLQPNWGPGY